MLLYKKNIWFILANLILLYHWALSSEPQYKKYWQTCFNAVFSTLMNMRLLNFPFQPNTNVETTLGHEHWINVTLSTLFQPCFVNVETTSINIHWLNFHFHPNFNIETMLVHWRWINIILVTLFQRYFVNVETTSINVRRLNFNFQPNINVKTTLLNVDDQRCFNVDFSLMCLLGNF